MSQSALKSIQRKKAISSTKTLNITKEEWEKLREIEVIDGDVQNYYAFIRTDSGEMYAVPREFIKEY